MFRSAASDGKTVRFIEEGEFVSWAFQTHSHMCGFDVLNVIYSNDGPSDNITVWLDGEYIDGFETFNHKKEGAFWNKMLESGLLGTTKALTAGDHTLNVSVLSVDVHGVEIDEVIVGVLCDDVEECSESLLIFGQPKPGPGLDQGDSQSDIHWTIRDTITTVVSAASVILAAIITATFTTIVSVCIYKRKHKKVTVTKAGN